MCWLFIYDAGAKNCCTCRPKPRVLKELSLKGPVFLVFLSTLLNVLHIALTTSFPHRFSPRANKASRPITFFVLRRVRASTHAKGGFGKKKKMSRQTRWSEKSCSLLSLWRTWMKTEENASNSKVLEAQARHEQVVLLRRQSMVSMMCSSFNHYSRWAFI